MTQLKRRRNYILLQAEQMHKTIYILKFCFSEKATKFEKIFVLLLTRASCSVCPTPYLSKSRQRFFKQLWSSHILQTLLKMVKIVILSENNCRFVSCSLLVTTFILFSAWDKSRVKWDNSRNSTQKMRTIDRDVRTMFPHNKWKTFKSSSRNLVERNLEMGQYDVALISLKQPIEYR